MLLLAALLGSAHASGFYITDHGNRALGRGGAFVAGADNLEAQFYNPAGLSRLEGPQVRLNLAAVNQFTEFQSAAGGLAVQNEDPPFLVPALAFGAPIGERLAVAVGLYTPHAPTFSYLANGAQRYSLISSEVLETSVGPSLSFRASDKLSLGAGVAWKMLGINQSLALGTEIGGTNSTTGEYDVLDTDYMTTQLALWDTFALSGNFGLIFEPSERWAFGASYSLPTSYEAVGPLTVDLSENYLYNEGFVKNESVTDDEARIPLTLPQSARLGALFRPSEALELELNVVWHGWSVVEEFLVTDLSLGFDLNDEAAYVASQVNCEEVDCHLVAEDDIAIAANYQDAFSVRLGGDYTVSDKLDVRGGAFFETSAVPEATLSAFLIDAPKVGYALGGTLRPAARWGLDLAWAQSFFFTQTVDASEAEEIRVFINALDLLETPVIGAGDIVGNGEYRSRTWTASLGVTHYFGAQ